MNFNNDNSTQLNIGSATFTPSYSSKTAPNLILNDSSSGIYNPSLNTIKFFTNNIDAFTIDENQCLYGNATGLTNLGYSNIINKPSTFPSDWGTLANKPSTFPADMTNIYTKTQTDSFLNTKQNILTFQSPLENAANTISLNTTNLITTTGGQTINGTLTTSGYLYTQNIQPINTGLAQNLNLTQRLTGNINFNCEGAGTINCIINGVNRFYVNSAGNAVLAGYLYEGGQLLSGKYQAKLTASTALLGIGSAITEINYDNITTNKPDLTVYATTTALNGKENILTFSAPLTRTLNAVSIDLSAYQPTLTFNSPMTKTGNNVSIDLSSYATTTALNGKENTLTFSAPLTRTTNTIGIDLSSYLTSATASTTYATITNLNAKENTLTFSAPLTRTTNNISIDLSAYSTTTTNNNNYLRLAATTNDLTGKLAILNGNGLTTPQTGFYGGTGDRLILWKGDAGAYPYALGMNGGTMWYSVPTGAVHNFYVNGTSILTIASGGLVSTGPIGGTVINEAGQALSARYLSLGGGTLTGQLNITHTSTAANAGAGGFYVYNPNTGAGNCSILGVRINGNVANRCGISLDVSGHYGWNVGINGNDTTNRMLRFNASWDNSGVDRMTLDWSGNLTLSGTVSANSFTEGGVSLASKYLTSASLDTTYLRLNGANSMAGNLNITGSATNALIFDNVFNNNKIKLNNNNGIGVDSSGVIICSSGATRFANSTGSVINATITPAGDFSFLGTVYSGAVSTGGTVYATGTITGGSFTEGGTTLNSKYLRLSGANNMTGNLNITNNGKLIFNNNIDDMRIQLWDGYGFGINGNTLRYNSPNTHRFYTGTATSMVINSAGNMGIGTDTPRARLDVYNNDMIVRGTNEGDVARLYLGTPYTVDSALKTAIIAEGINSWSRCKLHLCVNTILNNSSAYNASVADARLTIDTNGNVAIGQTSAAYPLVVTGTTNSFTITSASRKYDEYGPIGNTPPYNMTGIVAYFNGNVLTPGFYVAFSDERLKKEIEELSNDFALQTIMKLKPIKYNLIDNIYNNNINYGFSAQEVQKVLPEAVISTKHYLPNIYQNVDKVDNANSNIMIDANIIGSNLNVNDNIRIITHSNEEQIKKIVSINDNIITLDSKIDNYNDGDPLFLYGKEQEDIRCVNHNFLYNVNIKATQVLYEIIMKQQQEIEKLTNALISSNIISPL